MKHKVLFSVVFGCLLLALFIPYATQATASASAAAPVATAAPTPPPNTACPEAPAAINAFVTETCLHSTNRFRTVFSVSGYKPGETLSAWLVDTSTNVSLAVPEGRERRARCALSGAITVATVARCRDFTLNEYGNASGIAFDAYDLYPGLWALVLEATNSKVQSVLYFHVLPIDGIKDDPCATLPPSINATITPGCAITGTMYKIVGEGFEAGETLSYYMTGPDGIVEPITSYHHAAVADDAGRAMAIGLLADTALKGDYTVTIAGSGGHQAFGALRVR